MHEMKYSVSTSFVEEVCLTIFNICAVSAARQYPIIRYACRQDYDMRQFILHPSSTSEVAYVVVKCCEKKFSAGLQQVPEALYKVFYCLHMLLVHALCGYAT
jgi:hypothetical protein